MRKMKQQSLPHITAAPGSSNQSPTSKAAPGPADQSPTSTANVNTSPPGAPPAGGPLRDFKLNDMDTARLRSALDGRLDSLRRLRAKHASQTGPWLLLNEEIDAVVNLKGNFL